MLEILSQKKPKILVIGDVIVDSYLWCECSRVSPEAPVLIAKNIKQDKRLGGGANVYANLEALGADVFILSVIGDDENGIFLQKKVQGKLLIQKGRKTSLKQRIISHNQQVLRLDEEDTEDICLQDELLSEFETIVADYKAIVLSDYGKGLLTAKICQHIIQKARKLHIPVLIDPKGSDYTKYKGATLLTPNKKEALEVLRFQHLEAGNLELGIKKLKHDYELEYSLITLSELGIAFFDDSLHLIPAQALEVFDVTGAGDSVIAVLAFCLAENVPLFKACELANKIAGIAVSKLGNSVVSFEELKNTQKADFETKIFDKDTLCALIKKQQEKTIVFTNGCFDLLHFGHIKYLEKAKKLGDLLIVGLNSDRSVKELKGQSRPIHSQHQRACMLAALYFVDYVVIFDENTPYELIKALKPNILVKGADYKNKKLIGADLVEKVRLIDFEQDFSTTKIIAKIKDIK
ncbi:D-glycero-beta-D-manno-heptose-7-phosphate kinase [Campylobacter sp. MIT 21-1685]|uniref:D-glycero-beta-D-manno-heptose-7-phosphate kinase n=1 Tax=unclassified Campylobacter TaxID=2593542 RepID=UPI00224ABB8A|nr:MULTISPECIES: D-glycero-beta-D-manno-heptose-7-phosphate kinase [unclassified Campylobacter]MCX2683689.1 D-glycero-beta-D-manno-heptose-7-phosphate kinase [Campylobacter sp. MIT 21-1684]MCX2751974.1 D-glycero-beta-D-manno-heptose-7-phosphate kinase [Campylobacter sp. MIT 21-1682]MCX2808164.1 D-glycero-beta-D-manno-heptose-7-phosphate kinase [Campylobacter sp. MIT 21-1685]